MLEPIGEIKLPQRPPEIQTEIDRVMAMSPEQILLRLCKKMNDEPPESKEKEPDIISCYNCEDCKNKLKIYFPLNGEISWKNCNCISIRGSLMRAKNSGLADELGRCKISTFNAVEPWQQDAKAKAAAYSKNPDGWLYMCGQVGGGKTHLCTAIVGKLIHKGMDAKYMRWKDDAAELKAKINDHEYQGLIEPFLYADVLYIDDFLKTGRGENTQAKRPSTGDLNLAFQIINNRYGGKKTTIISSEHTIDELISYDEAVGSRIYEMSSKNCIMIPIDIQNNYRMKG